MIPVEVKKSALGLKGEQIAYKYLTQKGYTVIKQNWRFKHLEVDIVAQCNKTLVIVEVKTRSNDFVEQPHNAVTLKKQRFLVEAAQAYCFKNNIDLEVRFDIIGIVSNNSFEKITHIEDAFYPSVSKRR